MELHNRGLDDRVKELEGQLEDFADSDYYAGELQELRDSLAEHEEENQELEELREENQQLEELSEENQERIEELEVLEKRVEMFSGWPEYFEDTVQAEWPYRHDSRYNRVKVLLVSWASDDLGVLEELVRLGETFVYYYGYEAEHYAIPNHQASTALYKRTLEFIENDSPETLLIFYYSGHGTIHPDRNDAIWAA